MSWGYKITFLYLSFVAMILTLVFMSMQQDIHLVTENYYEKEHDFTKQVQNSFNSASLETPLQMDYQAKDKVFQLQFPQEFEGIEGTIQFYRPSDAKEDFEVKIEVDGQNLQQIDTKDLITGLWKIKVNWSTDGRTFFDEKQLILN